MITFESLWRNHVGRETVCDVTLFENQCAMRMGKALEESGLSLIGRGLKRCTDAYPKLKHKPGHIRSAQDLANIFYYDPMLLGPDVKKQIFKGSINKNISSFEGKQGMVFIRNGWYNGDFITVDHIDVWDGFKMKMKGAFDTADYRRRGDEVWFWELK